MSRIHGIAVGLCLAVLSGCGPPPPTTIASDELVGTWTALLEHQGTQDRFVMRFERDPSGTVEAIAAIPTIEAWAMPFGTTTVENGTEVHAGPWVLRWNPATDTLEGEMPGFLVPVHTIRAVLKRSGPIAATPPPPVDPPGVEPAWTFDSGAPIWAGVAHDDGLVLAGNDAGEVLALNAGDGKLRWRARTGGAVRARPTIAGSNVLVHSDDGKLYALDRRNGKIRWQSALRDGPLERVPPGEPGARYDHFSSSATVSGEVAYVGSSDGSLHAITLADGAKRWSWNAGDAITGTPAVLDGRVHVGSFDGNVYAIDAASGEPLWQHETGAPVPSSPAVAGDRIIVGSRSYDLLSLDGATGAPAWSYYYWFSWVDSDARVDGDTVFVGSSDLLRIHALDVATGKPRWTFRAGGWAWAQPAVAGQTVFAGTVGTTGYIGRRQAGFFALDRADGSPRWAYLAEAPEEGNGGFASSPATGTDKVFVGNTDGTIYAFTM